MNLKDPLITILIKKTPFNNSKNNLNLLNHNGEAKQPQQPEPEQSEPIPITGEQIMKVFVKILEIIDSRKG